MATTLTPMNPAVRYREEGRRLLATMYIKGIASPNIPFAAGQFLRKDTSNRLVPCVTSVAALPTSGGIQYVAQSDAAVGASGTDTVSATVEVIRNDMIFEGNTYSTNTAGGTTIADTDIGTQCGIFVSAISPTGSIVSVDIYNKTDFAVEITDVGYVFDPAAFNSTDIYAKCRFRVLQTAIDCAEAG